MKTETVRLAGGKTGQQGLLFDQGETLATAPRVKGRASAPLDFGLFAPAPVAEGEQLDIVQAASLANPCPQSGG